jgi:multiple sugar transport system substrate-binding protein
MGQYIRGENMKRTLLCLGIAVVIAVQLSAMGASGNDREDGEPVVITVALQVGPEADAHKRLANEFERQHPNIQVQIEEIARSVYSTQMSTALSGGSDQYDVVMFSTAHFPLWQAGGWIEPLDSYLAAPDFDQDAYDLEDFPAGIRNIFTRDGRLYGLPQEASAYLLFYRKDLLRRYGVQEPPQEGWSWDEYIDAAQTVQEGLSRDGLSDMVATVFPGSRNRNLAQYVLQNVWGNGGELLDDELRPQLTQDAALDGVKAYVDQLQSLDITTTGVTGYAYSELLTSLQQGQAVMGFQWNAAAASLLSSAEELGAEWGFSIVPYFESTGPETERIFPSIWGVGVSAFSENKEAAFQYASWFTSREVAYDYVTKGGGSSGRSSLLNDPEIIADYPQYPALLQSMRYYHALPDIPEWTFILEDILTSNWNAALVGEVEVEEAMTTANDSIETLLEEAGYY